MVVELLIMASLVVGFGAGVLVSKCCCARAPAEYPPPEVFADLFYTEGPFGEVFRAPKGKEIYHLYEDCQHLRTMCKEDYITMRTCKDCLREKACKEMRKEMRERNKTT